MYHACISSLSLCLLIINVSVLSSSSSFITFSHPFLSIVIELNSTNMTDILIMMVTVSAALAAIFSFVLYKVRGYRQQFSTIPSLPRTFWFGNAKDMDRLKKDKREHPGKQLRLCARFLPLYLHTLSFSRSVTRTL